MFPTELDMNGATYTAYILEHDTIARSAIYDVPLHGGFEYYLVPDPNPGDTHAVQVLRDAKLSGFRVDIAFFPGGLCYILYRKAEAPNVDTTDLPDFIQISEYGEVSNEKINEQPIYIEYVAVNRLFGMQMQSVKEYGWHIVTPNSVTKTRVYGDYAHGLYEGDDISIRYFIPKREINNW